MEEQVHSRHGDDDVIPLAGLFEIAHNLVALRRRCIDRNQVVVMEIHAPRAHLTQKINAFRRRQRFPHGITKRISSKASHGPQAKSKFVFRPGFVFSVFRHI